MRNRKETRIIIGVHRVGLVAAMHPPLVSHPPFNFAPRCRIGCKKIVLTSLHPNDTPPLFTFIPLKVPTKAVYLPGVGAKKDGCEAVSHPGAKKSF